MQTLIILVAFLFLAGTIGFILAAYTAPHGTQDERGFRIIDSQNAASDDLTL